MDPAQLKESILSFSLDDGPHGNQGYSRVLLQLFGFTGHGKSAFINSCKYVLEDGAIYVTYTDTGEKEDGGANTTERKAYDLTGNITIVDNRGYRFLVSSEKAEIYAQLGNFVPIGEKVEWMDSYTEMMNRLEDAELDPNYSDFIIPILVHSAKFILHDSVRKEVETFMDSCVKMTGVVPIIVITNKKSGDFIELEKVFKLMGAEVIIAIENYTKEEHIKTLGRTKDLLTVIHRALEDVRFRLRQGRDARKDRVKRKKFLLDYIHKADLENRGENGRRDARGARVDYIHKADLEKKKENWRRDARGARVDYIHKAHLEKKEENWRRDARGARVDYIHNADLEKKGENGKRDARRDLEDYIHNADLEKKEENWIIDAWKDKENKEEEVQRRDWCSVS